MTRTGCSLAECSVGVTGACVLSHTPASSCPNFLIKNLVSDETPSVARSEWKTRSLSAGNELGVHQVDALMAQRYATLVGLLGEAGTGKTCLLSSLYLLASCGELMPGLVFGGSATLLGFEQRLRNFRAWNEQGLPEQIVDHTSLSDPRRPGFVHLAFRETKTARTHDMVLSDLPGEWTTGLMKRASTAARFAFLQRADALVIAITAPSLLDPSRRHAQLQNARILLQRLRETVGVDLSVPLIFGLTRCDVSGIKLPPAAYDLAATAAQFGFLNTSTIPLAAFSDNDEVPSGLGLGELLDAVLSPTSSDSRTAIVTGIESPPSPAARMFERYTGGR